MTAIIKQLGVKIHVLRIDNKKVTASLFKQFDEGRLLNDIAWPGYLFGNDEMYARPFEILGRYSFKLSDLKKQSIPFIYSVNNEIKISTLSSFKEDADELLQELKVEMLDFIECLNEVTSLVEGYANKAIKCLVESDLLGGSFSEKKTPFYEWEPRFIDAAPHPVLFNSIQKKVLKDYCAVNKRLVCSSWENDGSQELAEAQKSLKIENFERCIRETKTDVQIKNWFELNREFISQEYSVAQTLYKRYESHIEELVEQILDSPKIYLEI